MNNDIYKKITSSGCGTLLAELVTLPICTIKTVYQNNPKHTINDSIKFIYRSSGYKGFVQASKPAILAQMISTSSKYTIYEMIKNYRKTKSGDIINSSINGISSGILGSLLTHPLDVWKNYRQRNESLSNTLIANSKLKVFYRGYLGALGKNVTLYSLLFPINDFYKNKFDNNIFISAPLTTISISLFIQPFDNYKVVKMANNKFTKPFRGLSLMLARSIPHFFITMYMTDYFENKLFHKVL